MLRIALGAALLALVVAGAVEVLHSGSAAEPRPVLLAGVITGPGFDPTVRTLVFATLNDEQDHAVQQSSARPALGRESSPSATGGFVLSIPVSALTPEAAKHDGNVNILIHVWNAKGASVEYGTTLKQTPDGNFAVYHIGAPLDKSIVITMPRLPTT